MQPVQTLFQFREHCLQDWLAGPADMTAQPFLPSTCMCILLLFKYCNIWYLKHAFIFCTTMVAQCHPIPTFQQYEGCFDLKVGYFRIPVAVFDEIANHALACRYIARRYTNNRGSIHPWVKGTILKEDNRLLLFMPASYLYVLAICRLHLCEHAFLCCTTIFIHQRLSLHPHDCLPLIYCLCLLYIALYLY